VSGSSATFAWRIKVIFAGSSPGDAFIQ